MTTNKQRLFQLPFVDEEARKWGCIYVAYRPGIRTSLHIHDGDKVDLSKLDDSPVYEHIVGIKYDPEKKHYEYSLDLTPEGEALWHNAERAYVSSAASFYEQYGTASE